jgi:hypothetical protein
MPADHAGRRPFGLAGSIVVGGLVWLALALGTSGESPAPSASPDDAPQPSPVATIPTPDASHGWLFESPVPEDLGPLASAPPLPAPVRHPDGGGANGCYDCHSAVNDEQAAIAETWSGSAHERAGVACADCHGGDPASDQITKAMDPAIGFVGTPGREESVGLCGSCHANVEQMGASGLATDQYAKYWSSVHGQRLAKSGDNRVAVCIDCHGSHDVRSVSDPASRVFTTNVPQLCAGCHADAKRMEPYGIPTDQFDTYATSVHGRALLEDKDVRAPTCASCHGSHDAKPPTSTTVVEVCGKCHTATQELYQESRHSELASAAPKCWTCHGTHDVSQPSSKLFFHPETPEYTCSTCHDLESRRLRLELSRFAAEEDRRCDSCHHPDSQIYAQIEGIASAVTGAETAYAEAETTIAEAARLGMITVDAELGLAGARTSLIQAQAAVHTTKLTTVAQLSADARKQAEEAQAMATAKVDESIFRRQAMVVVLAIIAACVLFLVLLKRQADRSLGP